MEKPTYKLIIEVEQNLQIAQDILKKYQFMIYKRAIGLLLGIIYSAVKKYKFQKVGDKTVFIEEGDKDYILMEKRKFENFMFSEEKELTKGKYSKFNKETNNRFVQKVARLAHKYKDKVGNKAIKAALGGTDVFSFFAKIGIFIKWKVEKA